MTKLNIFYKMNLTKELRVGAGFHPCPGRKTKEMLENMVNARNLVRVERERERERAVV